jgi:hypothetical protein
MVCRNVKDYKPVPRQAVIIQLVQNTADEATKRLRASPSVRAYKEKVKAKKKLTLESLS